MKAKILIFASILLLLILAVPAFLLIRLLNETPTIPLQLAPADGTDSADAVDPTKSIILNINAAIDGSDVMNITSSGFAWTHKAFQWPKSLAINGVDIDPHSKQPLSALGLGAADLSTAQVIHRSGRGTVAMELIDDGIRIHFSDPQSGDARYSIQIAFAPRSAAPAKLPATSAAIATHSPPDNPIFLDVKATMATGGDVMTVTPDHAQWRHNDSDWPSNVTMNGQAWDVRANPTLDNFGLADADLSTAQVVSHTGQDTAVMEKTDNGVVIYFSSASGGGEEYEMKIRFARKK